MVKMSRRKQSNPKPLKSETQTPVAPKTGEEDWVSEENEPPNPSEEVQPKKEVSPSPEPAPEAAEDPPKLRLNASLATDPALRSPALDSTPTPELIPPSQAQAILAGRFFPLLPLPPDLARPPSETAVIGERQTVPVFMCTPCGIRFSSLSTLEAHQTYYCSHRSQAKASSDVEEGKTGEGSTTEETEENPSKVQRTGKQYACTHCSYSADKKVSLNRHMRMHSISPVQNPGAPTTPVTNGNEPENVQDRYCQDCDIRFSSQKTYRAHKLHYCSTRHIVKPSSVPASSVTSGSAPTSPVESSCKTPPSPTLSATQQALLALPTNPILIVPYSLFRGASLLPVSSMGIPNPEAPCFLLPNGQLQPMSHAITPTTSAGVQTSSELLKENRDPSAPLDLSMRKSPELNDLVIDLGEGEEKKDFMKKDDRARSVTGSPEQIVCAPSLPNSPNLTPSPTNLSVSPKRKHESRSSSPRLAKTPKSEDGEKSTTPIPVNIANIPPLHPLLMRGPIINPEIALRLAQDIQATSPQVLVKQGVSKCKECNIVFCKHENYLAHKKHYCSARLQEDEATSKSPPISPTNSNGKSSPGTPYQQLICMACGIKFTSLDNLNAHQTYYCLKRNELQAKIPEVLRCLKCKNIVEPGHQCNSQQTGQRGWKCPCCDVVSLTSSGAQRHMETHSGVKAYRCTICKYKGNTLRGMRTHIRMHFPDKRTDLQEEKYITYILDEENPENPSPSTTQTSVPEGSVSSPSSEEGSKSSDKLHHCDSCSYSSTYKGNVIRHVKLVHNKSENGDPEKDYSIPSPDSAPKTPKSMPILEEEEIKVKIEDTVIDIDDSQNKEDSQNLEQVNNSSSKSGPKYCKSCDISFTYYSTFVAHKKFYCSSHQGEISTNNTNNNNNNNHTPTTRPPTEASVL